MTKKSKFSDEQINIIKTVYPLEGSLGCQKLMPEFSYQQITGKANYIGVRYLYNEGKITSNDFLKMTDESIYSLGFIWADGYVNKTNNQVKLHIKTSDAEYINSVFSCIGKWNVYTYPDSKSVEIAALNKDLHNWFSYYDYQNKSYVEPSKILSIIPTNKHFLFWLGYCDGDGSFYFTKQQGSNKLKLSFDLAARYEYQHTEFCNFLTSNSIDYSIRRRSQKKGKTSNVIIQKIQSLHNFGSVLYQTQLGLPRKKAKFTQFQSINPIESLHKP